MTREDRECEIRDYVRYLDGVAKRALADFGSSPRAIVGLGFSQGVHAVCRWAAQGVAGPRILVLWGDSIPPEEGAAQGLAGCSAIFAAGSKDPYWTVERAKKDQARLRRAGASAEVLAYDGGHRIESEALLQLARRVDRLAAPPES